MHEHECRNCKEIFNGDVPKDRIEHFECGSRDTVYLGTWGSTSAPRFVIRWDRIAWAAGVGVFCAALAVWAFLLI